eukprot:1160495-Pelagomonas_calceolata.AAC.6
MQHRNSTLQPCSTGCTPETQHSHAAPDALQRRSTAMQNRMHSRDAAQGAQEPHTAGHRRGTYGSSSRQLSLEHTGALRTEERAYVHFAFCIQSLESKRRTEWGKRVPRVKTSRIPVTNGFKGRVSEANIFSQRSITELGNGRCAEGRP